MPAIPSQSANNRVSGKFQSNEQRDAILDAAETLFLDSGIEKTTMIEIARRAGITRVTLYRYFANRDEVAVAVHLRLMKKDAQIEAFDPQDHSLEGYQRRVQAMIRNFPQLRDRYRYTGMFDQIYLDSPRDAALTQWTFHQLLSTGFLPRPAQMASEAAPFSDEINVIMSTVVWFLEKLALRGELTWSNQDVPLEEHLRKFEDMIMGYFDRLIESRDRPKNADPPPA
jgi:AcrR family transcriptional regulator